MIALAISIFVAQTVRVSTAISSRPPTLWMMPPWRKRSNLTWRLTGNSPISSRKSVPLWAYCNFPCTVALAPVNAPRSWPKNSDSRRFSGMAPQLIGINGPFLRKLASWMARATSSLPVPLSPVIKIGTSETATFRIVAKTACISGHCPSIPPLSDDLTSMARCNERFSSSMLATWKARPMITLSSFRTGGLA